MYVIKTTVKTVTLITVFYYHTLLCIPVMAKLIFSSQYSILQYHIILQNEC